MRKKISIGIFLSRPDRSFHMTRNLCERGFDVVNYSLTEYNGGPYVKLRRGFPYALSHLLLRTNHDVYFAGLSFTPSFSLYVNRMLRRKPYVFNLTGASWQCFDDRSAGKPFSKFLERRFYPFLMERVLAGASRIVCNSRFLELAVAERYPEHRERLLTIYNGIDAEKYSAGKKQAIAGLRQGDITLLYVTTLNYQNKAKGMELVVDAFGEIVASEPRAKLVIVAKVAHPRYSRWAQEYARAKPWGNSIIFLFNQTNIPDLLASSDIFVFATPHDSNDSLPRVLLEAQSAGLPAVTTGTTGCAEVVRDGLTGFVVPYDRRAFASKVADLIERPHLRARMGHEARRWIATTFTWERMADGYAGVFRELLEGGRRPGDAAPALSDRPLMEQELTL